MEISIEDRADETENLPEPSSLTRPRNLLQTRMWGSLKQQFGWVPHHLLIDSRYPVLVLTRRLPLGMSIGYIPYGPGEPISPGEWSSLEAVALSVSGIIPEKLLFLRMDPPWEVPEGGACPPPESRLRRATMDIQPPDTVVIDLTVPEEELLRGMKKKTRYNIGLSGKKGVVVRRGSVDEVPVWYRIYMETAKRNGIAIHSEKYYKTILELSGNLSKEGGEIRLYLAEINGRVEAGIFVSHYNGQAVYLYGASSSRGRTLMPAYGLQWRAILDAKRAGCTGYDLFGISPPDDPGHPMAGLYQFKTGFGGAIIHRPGSWDLPTMRLLYPLYRIAERFNGWYHRNFKKQLHKIGRKKGRPS